MAAERLDCRCFLTTNYFVDRVLDRKIQAHFEYDGTDESIREQLAHLGFVGDDGGAGGGGGLSETEFRALRAVLSEERDRRLRMDDVRSSRKHRCAERFRSKSRNDAAAVEFRAGVGDDDDDESSSSSWLDPKCRSALRVVARNPDATRRSVLDALGGTEVVPGRVFAFPVFTRRACSILDSELRRFGKECSDLKSRPNSMNRFGVLLDEAGMSRGVTDPLLRDVIVPLSSILFRSSSDGKEEEDGESIMIHDMCQTLDHHHAFTVDYRSEPDPTATRSGGGDDCDRDLSLHFDNAEVTLNVLIGPGSEDGGFDGGELSFEGPSPASPPSFKRFRSPIPYEHKLGWGVLHLGSEMHRALPVEDGERRNLIVWCRSAAHRLKHGCPMCGRKDGLVEPVLRRYLERSDP